MRLSLFAIPLFLVSAACATDAPMTPPDDPDPSPPAPSSLAAAQSLPLRGVSLAGADFGQQHLPGTFGTDYTYPTEAEVTYFLGKGMTTFRVPFLWERVQQQAKGALDATELGRLDAFVTMATGHGAFVVLDPHNYARYFGQVVGADAPTELLADFWSKLGAHYQDNPRVIFGLMNEPHDMSTEVWLGDANAAIAAIRAAGATNLILVPGNAWTGAHAWTESSYGTPNAQVMLGVTDPGHNYAFEVHQYLDSDSSGTMPSCVSATIGSQRMQAFTDWLRAHQLKGFLGETGAPDEATCRAALTDILTHVHQNADVYLGWAYWAAGPWWGDYFLSIEPANGQDRPQMAVLAPFLGGGGAGNGGGGGAGALTATLHTLSDWSSGYCLDVRVTNGGASAVDGWTVTLSPSDSTETQRWSATEPSPLVYRAIDADWSRHLAPGATTAFGFCADKTGPHPFPTVVSVE